MKKVIRANKNTNAYLKDQLSDDLAMSFEDNIIMKYATYVEDEYPRVKQEAIYSRFEQARSAYISAIADVIKHVDVDDFV